MSAVKPYKPKHHIRIVSATSLFDGHDAAINIMRRILQASGAEVIHLGHNRSVHEIVQCAIQEDAQAIAVTSYQGGHIEFFKYMYDLLREKGAGDIRIFGGGGGVILPDEMEELHRYGITRLFSPDDGRRMGLQGMINEVLRKSDFPTGNNLRIRFGDLQKRDHQAIARLISAAENYPAQLKELLGHVKAHCETVNTPVVGITGTGGAGKSSIIDELVRRFLDHFHGKTLAIISVDPSRRKTGGALLGDRIRMNAIDSPRVFMRSLATRQSNLALSKYVKDALCIVKSAGFDLILLETSGIGQSDTEIVDHSDLSLYVMTPEYGAATQLEKIDMLDFADLIAINKFDKSGGEDALRDVRKQYQRNHLFFEKKPEDMPVYGTIASHFNDPGVNRLYQALLEKISEKTTAGFPARAAAGKQDTQKIHIIPPKRIRYLSEISDTVRAYNEKVKEQVAVAHQLDGINLTLQTIRGKKDFNQEYLKEIEKLYREKEKELDPENRELLRSWKKKVVQYRKEYFIFKVREKEVKVKTYTESLSHLKIPKITLPKYDSWGEILKWNLKENVPGEFPYAAGVFPFKRENEDSTRMFAGEGGPERTNKRFHYLSHGLPAKRLSTAFDSVTLYGFDPDTRPDIFGKVGNSGVSIACLEDTKKLYS